MHISARIFCWLLIFSVSCGSKFDINQAGETLFTSIPSDYSHLTFENNVVQTRENNHLLNVEFVSGGGVAVGDIDNDGLQDVFFTGNQVSDRLYLNKGDFKFEDISKKAGISQDNKWSTSVTFVDIDADGDQDIYVCRFVYLENDLSANQLYINNGDLTFTEKADEFGIADIGFSTNATFFDFDKDNLVDLYVVNQPPSIPGRRGKISRADLPGIQFSDRLYKNIGNGKFIDHTENSGIRNFGFGLSALVGDFNNDSWQDIYISNDFDVADHLYINQRNGTFIDMIKQETKHITNFSMGSDAADYDNDGNLDIMVVDMVHEDKRNRKSHMTNIDTKEFINNIMMGVHHQYMTNTLQRNNGNGTFSDLARLAGVDKTGWSWGPLFADFDNDGFKDIFITNGVIRNNLHSDLAELYEQKLDSLRNIARMNNKDPNKLIEIFDFVNLAAMDEMPNYMYRNNGDYTFSNMIVSWGFSKPTTSNGAAYADFDLDGDLDIVVNNLNSKPDLYKNNASEKKIANFLRIGLKPSIGNSIYGTKISIYKGKDDKPWQVYHIINTRGFRSKSEGIAHFGVGKETEIGKVAIEWQNNTISILENVSTNKYYILDQDDAIIANVDSEGVKTVPLFKEVTDMPGLEQVLHTENNYNDFDREVLLPYRLSHVGPSIAVGDVNGDRLDDFYLGGSAGFSGTLFIQSKSGKFKTISNGAWTEDKASEDTDAVFVDVDNDWDLDLIVVSGGNEFDPDDPRLTDRLYLNNGSGMFTRDSNRMPDYLVSSSCVAVNDFDNDGDQDLFIGGRLIPKKYPFPASSYLLENKGGKFTNVTTEKAPDMIDLGLITAASWTDYNNDMKPDLVVVGEWMPITVFAQNEDGSFEKKASSGLENTEGWYYEIQVDDMDGDGDQDFVVGNLGLNYTYKATPESPLEIFSGDFDLNGSNDIVISYSMNDSLFPWVDRDRAIRQIPSIEKEYGTFTEYSNATTKEIYGESLEKALHLKAKTFSSIYVENLGNDKFQCKPLPSLAQASAINCILIKDFDEDGNKDLLIAGNLYQTEIEMPRHDAGTGLLLVGNGKGEFKEISTMDSGFFTPNDVKDMAFINVAGKHIVLVGNNNSFLQTIEYIPPEIDM